ncbi:hypothetical protein Ocin01_03198 [Orchesella cincta]|uniref:Uncharacterized protein n=1 Tax=Orchesella cincta TaxID=48709 RepID=A0A1D2NDZ3_ORCCI|nr:hypothetical protein Ocin01_03198 [Orchesella cincta]
MQSVAVFLALAAVASAATVYHVPSADSAVIESHRLGGSFAYSTSEAQGLGVVSPVVQNIASPVATTYTSGLPVATSYTSGLPVTSYSVQGLPVSSYNVQGLPVSSLGNVAVVKTGQVQNVQQVQQIHQVVPQVQQVQQYQVAPQVQQVQQYQVVPSTVSGYSTLSNINLGALPVSSYVVAK